MSTDPRSRITLVPPRSPCSGHHAGHIYDQQGRCIACERPLEPVRPWQIALWLGLLVGVTLFAGWLLGGLIGVLR